MVSLHTLVGALVAASGAPPFTRPVWHPRVAMFAASTGIGMIAPILPASRPRRGASGAGRLADRRGPKRLTLTGIGSGPDR